MAIIPQYAVTAIILASSSMCPEGSSFKYNTLIYADNLTYFISTLKRYFESTGKMISKYKLLNIICVSNIIGFY